jgi:hypothetical protein
VRVSVRDGTSGRIGSASQFLSVPDASSGQLAVTGVTMSSNVSAAADAALVHVFHPDETFTIHYQILNLTADENKHSRIESQSSILRDGKVVFASKPGPVDFTRSDDPKRRAVTANIWLGKMEPGVYALQITVRDTVSKEARTAAQYTFFEVK